MFKHPRILKAMCTFLGKALFSTLFIPFPYFFCHESENMSNRTELQAHNEMMSNLIKVLLILPSLLQGGRDGFSTLIFPWCRL